MAWKCNVPCGLLHCCRRCWGQAHGGNLSSPQTTPVVATTSTREGAKRPSPRPRVADGAAAATRGGCSICCGLTRLPEWLSPLSQCAVVVRAAAASRGCCSCSCQRGRRHGLALGLESRHSAWWWPRLLLPHVLAEAAVTATSRGGCSGRPRGSHGGRSH
jgi:hypothetical protein